jgi:hypothetical protein
MFKLLSASVNQFLILFISTPDPDPPYRGGYLKVEVEERGLGLKTGSLKIR